MKRQTIADKERQADRDVCTGYHDALAAAVEHLFQRDFGTLQSILMELRDRYDSAQGKGDKAAADRAFMARKMFENALNHEHTKASR